MQSDWITPQARCSGFVAIARVRTNNRVPIVVRIVLRYNTHRPFITGGSITLAVIRRFTHDECLAFQFRRAGQQTCYRVSVSAINNPRASHSG